MSKWEKIEIGNIPKDIFDNDKYEYEDCTGDKVYSIGRIEISKTYEQIISYVTPESDLFTEYKTLNDVYYRKKQIQRTHAEIMTKWFKLKDTPFGDSWVQVLSYTPANNIYYISGSNVDKSFFDELPMADIPPEK